MSAPLDLVPGHSFGPFHLGSMLFNVLNHLRTYRSAYANAKIAWDEENPSTGPIHLTLSSPPLHLLFSSLTQRLSRIEVSSSSSSASSPGHWVSYRGRPLQGAEDEEEDTVKVVRRALGPTYGSSKVEADEASGKGREEMLSYPGVAFGVVAGPSGTTLSRIILTPLPSPADIPVDRAWLHPVLPLSPPAATGDLRLAEICLDSKNIPSRTILHFYGSDEDAPPPFELKIGETTSEDILCELGGAIRTFWKEDDRMSIHTASLGGASPSSAAVADDPSLSPNPYFLSYPHLGLTLLLASSPTPLSPSPSSTSSRLIPPHTLLKLILHSNLPGESNFGRTARALWAFRREGGEEGEGEKGRLGGVEDGLEGVRRLLRSTATTRAVTTEKKGDGEGKAAPSPAGSGISSSSSSSNGGGGKKGKKPSATAATKLKEAQVENLLGLSTFNDATALPPPPAVKPYEFLKPAEEGTGAGVGEGEGEKPMILDRGADVGVSEGGGGGEGGGGKKGGAPGRGKTTEIHGFPGIALEVTQEGEVETVWLF